MKPIIPFALLGALLAVGAVKAAETTPVGYTVTSCLPNSDTIVGLPLRISATAAGALTSAPSGTTGSAVVLTSSSAAFPAVAGTHYVKFKTGGSDGKWYPITANTATTLTVNLGTDTLAAVSGDSFEVLKYWTLGELFVPSASTTSPTTTGNAIVASGGTGPLQRRTEVLLPDLTSAGTNLAPNQIFFISGGAWRKSGAVLTDSYDTQPLFPDTYFIIRHPSAVTSATSYTIVGEVEPNKMAIPLDTQASGKQDNFIALPRPIDLTLNELNLKDSGAFLASAGTGPLQRRDELLVFDNAIAARNKSASAIYYTSGGTWRKSGDVSTDVGTQQIKGGYGFIIRKYQVAGAPTQYWVNPPTY